MPRSSIFGMVMPWCFPRCGTGGSQEQAAPAGPPDSKAKRSSGGGGGGGRVESIDNLTTVPLDLYVDLMKAGQRAKRRGSHELSHRPSETLPVLVRGGSMPLRSGRSDRPVLVKSGTM